MSATTCPVFHPTMEEFTNFSRYIAQIEKKIRKKYGSENVGICKVVPPEGWYKPYYDPHMTDEEAALTILDKFDYLKILPIRQCPNGNRGSYQLALTELKKMTPREFYFKAKKSCLDTQGLDNKEVEKRFWKSLGPLCETPMYGADLQGTLFGEDPASGWNLNRLDNMIKLLPSNLPGITSSMLYFGMWRAMFAWHTEDVNLYSINYLHMGHPKSWYSVPPKHARRLESVAMVHFADGFRTCKEFMRHKTSMMSPKSLADSGIPIHMVVQQPGEFVITFPDSYHAGFNHGFNVAEATNFTTEGWIKEGLQARVCQCQPYAVHINMDNFQAMLALKKAEDMEKVSQIAKTKLERKQMLRTLMFEGWLDWQQREESRLKAEKEQRRKKKAETKEVRERKRKEREEAMLIAKEELESGPQDKKPCVRDYQASSSMKVEGEEWNFDCSCGVRASSEDPLERHPFGSMFECRGCLSWCHSHCIYGSEVVPPLAFCHKCHLNLLRLRKHDKKDPLVRGKNIKLLSRVVVMETIKGIAEGTVVDLSPDAERARVHFTPPGKKGQVAFEDEWIPTASNRFLSDRQIDEVISYVRRRHMGGDQLPRPAPHPTTSVSRNLPPSPPEQPLLSAQLMMMMNRACSNAAAAAGKNLSKSPHHSTTLPPSSAAPPQRPSIQRHHSGGGYGSTAYSGMIDFWSLHRYGGMVPCSSSSLKN